MSARYQLPALIVSTIFVMALPAAAFAQTSARVPRVQTLKVVSSGFTGPGEKIEPGKIRRLFSRTPAVDARAGTGFGMTVRPVGEPKGADVVLRWVWKAPRPGIRDMNTGKLNRQVSEEVPAKIGEESRRTYVFKEANDIVLGNWRVEVWSGRRRLVTRRFAVR
jgi:hypothetical protein